MQKKLGLLTYLNVKSRQFTDIINILVDTITGLSTRLPEKIQRSNVHSVESREMNILKKYRQENRERLDHLTKEWVQDNIEHVRSRRKQHYLFQ